MELSRRRDAHSDKITFFVDSGGEKAPKMVPGPRARGARSCRPVRRLVSAGASAGVRGSVQGFPVEGPWAGIFSIVFLHTF